MALNINGRMKVKTLKSDFKNEFGLSIRVYDGRSFADDDATLASIRKGDSKGGTFAPKRNMKVGNLEDKIMEMFGIKTQIAGSEDTYLCKDELTLAKAKEADEKKITRAQKNENKTEMASSEEGITNIIDDVSLENILLEIKETYASHDSLLEMIDDLSSNQYIGHWAGNLLEDEYGNNQVLAKKLILLGANHAKNASSFEKLASKAIEIDKELAIDLYKKSESVLVSVKDANSLAKSVFDNLSDKEWVKTLFQKAEELSLNDDSLTPSIIWALGKNVAAILEDKEWAKTLFQKAENIIEDSDEFLDLANKVDIYIGDTEWSQKLIQLGIDNANDVYALVYASSSDLIENERKKILLEKAEKLALDGNDIEGLRDIGSKYIENLDDRAKAKELAEALVDIYRETKDEDQYYDIYDYLSYDLEDEEFAAEFEKEFASDS